jgi:alanyl-tRNA synthetase
MDSVIIRKPKTHKLPDAVVVGRTTDGKPLVDGAWLFNLKTTHGLPLDMALDKIINEHGYAVDWVGFIQEARRNGWWDIQTYETLTHAMQDAELPRRMQVEIAQRFQEYVLKHPHPKVAPV